MIGMLARGARRVRRLAVMAVAAAGLVVGVASPALAQDPIPPPKHSAVDAHGVDLISGAMSVSATLNGIGPTGMGGLAASETLKPGYPVSSMFSYVKLHPNGGDGSETTLVAFLGQSQEFDGVPEAEPTYNEGNKVQKDATHIVYTLADGTVGRFRIVQINPIHPLPVYGLLQSVTYPSGEVLTFTYGNQTIGPGWMQVESSLGYALAGAISQYDWDVWSANLTLGGCSAAVCSGSPGYAPFPSQEALGRVPTKSVSGSTVTIHSPAGGTPKTYVVHTSSSNPNGTVSSVSDGLGTWNYSYDQINDRPSQPEIFIRIVTVTDPLGNKRVVRSRSNTQNILSDTIGIKPDGTGGDTTTFQYTGDASYSGAGVLNGITLPEGNRTRYVYDLSFNVIEKWYDPKPGSPLAPTVMRASYNTSLCVNRHICNRPDWIRDERGNQTDFTWDPTHGGVLTITKPAADNGVRPQTRFTYGQFTARYISGAAWVVGTPVWRLTQSSTCIIGGPAVGTAPAPCVGTSDEQVTALAYEASGLANNVRLLSTTTRAGDNSLAATVANTYDPRGDVITVDGPLPGSADTTRTYYDGSRWAIGVIGPDPDGAGTLRHRATRTTYDNDGQASLVETGNATNQSDSGMSTFLSRHSAVTGYDAQRRKSAQSLVVGGITRTLVQYGYDAASRPICQTVRMNPAAFASPPAACILGAEGGDGPDRITYSELDAAGRVTKVISGHGTGGAYAPRVEKKYAYRPNGQVGLITDGANNTTSLTYDGLDRLTYTHYPVKAVGAQQANPDDYDHNTYDPAGNVVQRRKRDGGLIDYTYDALNRVIYRNGAGVRGWYLYDNLSKPTASFSGDAAERVTSFYYDPLGRPTATYDHRGDAWRRSSYEWFDLAGRRTALQWADGFYVNYTRDVTGAVTAIHENGAGILAAYGYDDLGRRVVAYRVNGANSFYGYDPAGQLETLSLDLAGSAQDQGYTFTYNVAGQLKSRAASNSAYEWTGAQATKSYTVNGLNQYLTAGSAILVWGPKGNLGNDGTRIYTYDAESRLRSGSGPTPISLTYDPQGRLDTTLAGSTAKRLVYSGVDLIEEIDASNNTLARYVPGPNTDEPLVWYDGSGSTDRRFLLADERGSIVAVTNASGAWTGTAPNIYDEYGIPAAGNQGRYQYTGQTWLPELGLYHYKARVYSPTLGRFLQTDPTGYKDGLNWYAYTGNDPMNRSDPTGNDSLQLGINIQIGPFRFGAGSYRVGKGTFSIFDSSSSTGRYKSVGGGFGLAAGVEVQLQYCKRCESISDIQGRSGSLQADLGVGTGVGETSQKMVPDGMGGVMPLGGSGKVVNSVSIGPSVGLVPVGQDYTWVDPYSGEGTQPSTPAPASQPATPPPPPPPPPSCLRAPEQGGCTKK